ncbi:MAG: hypothetical protein AABZ80_07300 [Gemmatimonadota bacterium]
MTNHIDLGTVLRQTLSASLYSNLVTRPTGLAVRTQIESLLADTLATGRALTVIDFSHVSMIDFSCADEIIAKLLMSHGAQGLESYFVFRGMTEDHWDAIETVLERHGLALVVERDDGVEIVGVLALHERRAWDMLKKRGRLALADLPIESDEMQETVRDGLDALCRRRLIMRANDMYVPVGELA